MPPKAARGSLTRPGNSFRAKRAINGVAAKQACVGRAGVAADDVDLLPAAFQGIQNVLPQQTTDTENQNLETRHGLAV